jgi:CRISPR-associated endonuclease Csn1
MKKETILGIDLGSNSIGWALCDSVDRRPVSLIKTGVRVFEAGLEEPDKGGKRKSRNVERREARLRRRQTDRRSRRLGNLARLLQRSKLLPPGNLDSPEERHQFFTAFDKTLPSPYQLRAIALAQKLSPYEIGRALYHLGQRRGFLSNRKAPAKKDEDKGVVKGKIEGLLKEIEDSGARTLGEYLCQLESQGERIRRRHTDRKKMYEVEFDLIWETQRTHHPDILTDELKKKVHHAIFRQRPLKSQKGLVGKCSLEKGRTRAPQALLCAQRFRYLQKVNDLRVIDKKTGEERGLTPEERTTLAEAFETEGDLSFKRICDLLNLKRKDFLFNLEEGGEKKIPGNRTAKALSDVFKDRWAEFSDQTRDAIVEDMRSIVKDETQVKRGMKVWGLDEQAAEKFGHIELEEDYCNFSKKAIEKLLPFLIEGKPLAAAINEAYPGRRTEATAPLDFLPPVRSALGDPRKPIGNPIVERALTELRKIVNTVIRKYGKPDYVRIELARDIRRSAKERESAWKKMRTNEESRKKAEKKTRMREISNPKPNDILKVLLAEECNWECPYTGRTICMRSLVGDNPQFDIEHIIPFHRSLDNSFFNKTLCYTEENRRKHNRTPFEAYSGTDKWDDILERVRKFKGEAAREKFKRFTYTEDDLSKLLDSFSSQQLNDTRYAARLAKRYVGLLYGGLDDNGIDAERKLRVQATTGQVTAHVRNALGLNGILGDGPGKSRDDHRHHAVDAVAIALTEQSTIKRLSDAAKRSTGRRLFERVEPPWETFLEDVRNETLGITVSHRVSKRVRGALHQETFYSALRKKDGKPRLDGKKPYVHIRMPVEKLGEKDIENIVDDAVRKRVREKLKELGGAPKDAFKDESNHPFIQTKTGKKIPIHKVRVKQTLNTFPVGSGRHVRHVQSNRNHHMEIVEITNTGKWEGHVVSMLEAYRRLSAGEPVVKRDHGPDKKFLFSLASGEIIKLHKEDGTHGLYVLGTVPQSKQVVFKPINDARIGKEIPKPGRTAYPETLRKWKCQKVVVTPLGEVRNAND